MFFSQEPAKKMFMWNKKDFFTKLSHWKVKGQSIKFFHKIWQQNKKKHSHTPLSPLDVKWSFLYYMKILILDFMKRVRQLEVYIYFIGIYFYFHLFFNYIVTIMLVGGVLRAQTKNITVFSRNYIFIGFALISPHSLP
jgi:hypothetical protein